MSPCEDMIITAMFTLICYTSQATFSSGAQCEEAARSIPNLVLAGHAFFTKQSPNIEDCVMSCVARDPLCESTNYYRQTKVCELNDKTAESNPEDLVDYDWAIYMTNSLRLLSCNRFDSECGRQTDICQIKQGGSKCEACYRSLGMENGKIPDSAITASSFYDFGLRPIFARLNSGSAWARAYHASPPHWLQVDLSRIMAVKMVATQGRRLSKQRVTSYSISSSVDEIEWVKYMEKNAVKIFQGNTDQETVVSHMFSQHIRARFIRIFPQTWDNYLSMRVELYGCSIE